MLQRQKRESGKPLDPELLGVGKEAPSASPWAGGGSAAGWSWGAVIRIQAAGGPPLLWLPLQAHLEASSPSSTPCQVQPHGTLFRFSPSLPFHRCHWCSFLATFLLSIGKVRPDHLFPDLIALLPGMTPLRNDLEGLKEHLPKCNPMVALRNRHLGGPRHSTNYDWTAQWGIFPFSLLWPSLCVEGRFSVQGHCDHNTFSDLLISFHGENGDLGLRILIGTSIKLKCNYILFHLGVYVFWVSSIYGQRYSCSIYSHTSPGPDGAQIWQ